MSRLNVQGLARRDKGLMSCLVADPGKTIVSIDLSAGEPTVTTHFSQDPNYRYACFDGVGKAPYYANGTLMISDIYLMTMSRSPVGKSKMLEAFNTTWSGRTFAEQWLVDEEVIKKALKAERQLHKMLALALGYGMQPPKMVKQCYDNGYSMDLKTAREFYTVYWQIFNGVKRFADKCKRQFESTGHLVNPFGYRLVPDRPSKAFNYLIQSSVSGIINVFSEKLFTQANYANFISCIHDELLVSVPDDMLGQFKADKDIATTSLNEDLRWSVAIRTGFAPGKTWYEAK